MPQIIKSDAKCSECGRDIFEVEPEKKRRFEPIKRPQKNAHFDTTKVCIFCKQKLMGLQKFLMYLDRMPTELIRENIKFSFSTPRNYHGKKYGSVFNYYMFYLGEYEFKRLREWYYQNIDKANKMVIVYLQKSREVKRAWREGN